MTWLNLWFALQVGFLPFVSYEAWDNEKLISKQQQMGSLKIELSVRVTAWIFFIGGDSDIYSGADGFMETMTFAPHTARFVFEGGIHLDFFEFGYRHTCVHPIVADYNPRKFIMIEEAGNDEVYLRLELGKR